MSDGEPKKSRLGLLILAAVLLAGAAVIALWPRRIEQAGRILNVAAQRTAGKSPSAVPDFHRICEAFTEGQEKSFPDEQARTAWIVDRVSTSISHPNAIMAFRAVGLARPEDKWRLLKMAAAEEGDPDWSCPALEKALSVPTTTLAR